MIRPTLHFSLFSSLTLVAAVRAEAETIVSPGGHLAAEVSVVDGRLTYSVRLAGQTLLEPSPLGFTMNGDDRGSEAVLGDIAPVEADESFPSRHGVHRTVRDRYRGKRISVTHAPSGRSYVLEFRAYDSGVAFRYELDGEGAKNITADSTGFVVPAGTTVFWQAGTEMYEDVYRGEDISAIQANSTMGPPVVAQVGGTFLSITHSGPGDGFPCSFLTKVAGGSNRLLRNTYPKNGDNTYGASTGASLRSPWTVITAGSLETLVNSDVVEAVAPAPDPEIFPQGVDTPWARPGRSVWNWMARFPGGITAENSKIESEWAGLLGFEYNTIDEGWSHWNGGDPWLQLAEIVAHSRPLNVDILVWVRSRDIRTRAQRADFFGKLRAAGVAGIKADFFDFNSVSPAAKERVKLIERILKDAAAHKLVVNLHGSGRPLGQYRTYPNLIGVEAVHGKEQYPDARASVYAPLTRLLAGPADYTPLGLEGMLKGNQSRAFEIATVINMAGPLITLAERGDRIARSPFSKMISAIPCFWDETKIIPGTRIGESCGMLRRSGSTWYAAIMNGAEARDWRIDLGFLNPDRSWQAEIVRDGSSVPEYRMVSGTEIFHVSTAAGGGFVARFTAPEAPPVAALPFTTSFQSGRGSIYAENGVILSDQPWASDLLEDRLPDTLWSLGAGDLTASFDETDAWRGGSSVKIAGTLGTAQDLALFSTDLDLSANTRLHIAYKRGAASASGMKVGLVFEDAPDAPVLLSVADAGSDGWETQAFPLAAHAGRKLERIFLRFGPVAKVEGYEMKLGLISLSNGEPAAVAAASNLRAQNTWVIGLDSLKGVLNWDAAPAGVSHYGIYQVNPLDGAVRWHGVTRKTTFPVTLHRMGDEASTRLRLVAFGADGASSAPVEISVALPPRAILGEALAGTVIGTDGSFQNSGNTREKAFDGGASTFFDANVANGAWAGIDLGSDGASRIRGIRFHPRENWSSRMTGGAFEGANQSDFSDAVTLATVSDPPTEGTFTVLSVTHTHAFRYLRYRAPNGSWGNVAEISFHPPGPPPAPEGVKADRNESSARIEWAPVAAAQSYRIKRSGIAGGPYAPVGTNVTHASFLEAELSRDATCFYVVSSVSPEGMESPDSAEVEAVDSYRAWLARRGWIPDNAGTAFDQDADGNGMLDGIEYAVASPLRISDFTAEAAWLTTEVIDDPMLNVSIFASDDLLTWDEIPADLDADQNGVGSGLRRIAFRDTGTPLPKRKFYRLSVSR